MQQPHYDLLVLVEVDERQVKQAAVKVIAMCSRTTNSPFIQNWAVLASSAGSPYPVVVVCRHNNRNEPFRNIAITEMYRERVDATQKLQDPCFDYCLS